LQLFAFGVCGVGPYGFWRYRMPPKICNHCQLDEPFFNDPRRQNVNQIHVRIEDIKNKKINPSKNKKIRRLKFCNQLVEPIPHLK